MILGLLQKSIGENSPRLAFGYSPPQLARMTAARAGARMHAGLPSGAGGCVHAICDRVAGGDASQRERGEKDVGRFVDAVL